MTENVKLYSITCSGGEADPVCLGVPCFLRFFKSVRGHVLPPKADLQKGQQNQVSAGGSTHKGLSCPFPPQRADLESLPPTDSYSIMNPIATLFWVLKQHRILPPFQRPKPSTTACSPDRSCGYF